MSLSEGGRYNLENLYWNPRDQKSMENAQIEINDMILTKKLKPDELTILKDKLKALQRDLKQKYIYHCHLCQFEYDVLNFPNQRELITIKENWGYESGFDMQSHKLVLCDECYGKTIYAQFKDVMEIIHH